MQIVYNDPRWIQRQRWQEFWPTTLVALIATAQMLLTFAIIAFETWSLVLCVKYSFVAIGYETAFFFTITWISTYTVVCCNRGSEGCATHALVENILSLAASIILIAFDSRFIQNVRVCYWPDYICSDFGLNLTWNDCWNSFNDPSKAKLIAIKLQLTCAVIMLVLCLAFIGIYIYTSIKVKARPTIIHPQPMTEFNRQLPPPTPSAPQPPIQVWTEQQPAWPPSSTF